MATLPKGKSDINQPSTVLYLTHIVEFRFLNPELINDFVRKRTPRLSRYGAGCRIEKSSNMMQKPQRTASMRLIIKC